MVTAEQLKAVPLFAALAEEQLATLARCMTVHTFPRSTFVLRAGEKADDLYVMLSGRAKVLMLNEEGHEIILAVIGAGEFFGEMGLLDDHPRSASVQALERCELIRVSKLDFMRCLLGNVEFGMGLILGLVRRLRAAERQIESLALMDVYGRVVRVLLDLAETIDGVRVIRKAPAKQEIARMIGASREMVSHVMTDLRNAGHICVDKRRIVLLEGLRSDNHTLPSSSWRGGRTRTASALSSPNRPASAGE
jgi:CRP/FNR family cyclic AMP-dependent transcriptional regulator